MLFLVVPKIVGSSFGNELEKRWVTMESKQKKEQQIKRHRPRLERLNAIKNVDYKEVMKVARGASWSNSCPSESFETLNLRTARSLDVFPSLYTKQSFRIDGSCDNEVEILCHSLGLSGPDDFAISVEDWENRRARLPSDIFARSRLLYLESSESLKPVSVSREELQDDGSGTDIQSAVSEDSNCESPSQNNGEGNGAIQNDQTSVIVSSEPNVSLSPRTSKPSVLNPALVLKPPPYMVCPPTSRTMLSSSWDIIRSFGPDDEGPDCGIERREPADPKDFVALPVEVVGQERLVGDTTEDSTSNDDEISNATTDIAIAVSPNSKLKRRIKSWTPGQLLGCGSYGRVFEAISEEGVFFAVKEVSSNAHPCVSQLEQEIALLSQFEHENIVQYYGTDKEEGKLFIFLELVSQGSIVALYQKYLLQDSQVSAYTKQILNGLCYLHERNVVHRDIKCANILVHANGSVKLADFGLAKEMTKIDMLKSCKGSVYWMAPEVVNPRRTYGYGPAADIWSLGCTVLEMLTRDIPFPNLEWAVAFYMIGQGQQPPIPNNLSRVARDFIAQCVRVNPDDRPTAAELLEHPFIIRSSPATYSYFHSESNGRW